MLLPNLVVPLPYGPKAGGFIGRKASEPSEGSEPRGPGEAIGPGEPRGPGEASGSVRTARATRPRAEAPRIPRSAISRPSRAHRSAITDQCNPPIITDQRVSRPSIVRCGPRAPFSSVVRFTYHTSSNDHAELTRNRTASRFAGLRPARVPPKWRFLQKSSPKCCPAHALACASLDGFRSPGSAGSPSSVVRPASPGGAASLVEERRAVNAEEWG